MGLCTKIDKNIQKEIVLEDRDFLRAAAYYDLTGTPIDIGSNAEWATTAAGEPWCTGAGTWSDPYIIENVFIDGQNTTDCINIRNSNVYFIIRNCTLINAAKGDFGLEYAGLKLQNVGNGTLFNNTCSFNNQIGIILLRSSNNTIIDCIANGNKDWGITIYWDSLSSNNNTVKECTANNNGIFGIHVYHSNYNRIIGNKINGSNQGITMHGITHNNTFKGNTITFPKYIGLELGNGYDNKIIGNNIFNTRDGFHMFSCYRNIITDNNIVNVNLTGIGLGTGAYNVLKGNYIENTQWGMYLVENNYTNIVNNNVTNGESGGIRFHDGYHSSFLSNTIKGSNDRAGLDLGWCYNTTITHNILNDNYRGLGVDHCDLTNIEDNRIKRNSKEGIFIEDGDNTFILHNFVDKNDIGISLEDCIDTLVSDNELYCNRICIQEINCIGTVRQNNSCVSCPKGGVSGFYVFILLGFLVAISLIITTRLKRKTLY